MVVWLTLMDTSPDEAAQDLTVNAVPSGELDVTLRNLLPPTLSPPSFLIQSSISKQHSTIPQILMYLVVLTHILVILL